MRRNFFFNRSGKINDQLQSYWIKKGPTDCNNKTFDFAKSARIYYENGKPKIRSLNKSVFQIKLHNGEAVEREWLLYSPSNGCVYCFVCLLFSTTNDNLSTNGFNDWKHSERIGEHEKSKSHSQNSAIYCQRRDELHCINTR